MGGCVSDRNDNLKKQQIAFSSSELEVLHLVYQFLLSKHQQNGHLTEKSMIPFFRENPEFSIKLYKWMGSRSRNGQVDYDTFVITLELLLKDQVEYYLSDYKYRVFEKIELFCLISLGCMDNDRDTLNRMCVTYSQGLVIVKEILNIFNFDKEISNAQKNDLAARVVANSIFESITQLPFLQFIQNIKRSLLFSNGLCRKYFLKKFGDVAQEFVLPTLDQPSFILNDQVLGLFVLSSPQFQQKGMLKKLYSSSVGVDDFEDMAQVIVESTQSMLMIFRNRQEGSQSFEQQVFGAYIHIDPLNEQHHVRRMIQQHEPQDKSCMEFGDDKSFLFSIVPNFQIFLSTYEKCSQRAYGYINARSFDIAVPQPYGLGFGGDGQGNHRIWIDENLKQCKLNRIDNECEQTYESGMILDPHIVELNLTAIEIWGIQ